MPTKHSKRRIIHGILELRKIFNTDQKGLLGQAASGDKTKEFSLSFNSLELRVKHAVRQKSMNSTAKVKL